MSERNFLFSKILTVLAEFHLASLSELAAARAKAVQRAWEEREGEREELFLALVPAGPLPFLFLFLACRGDDR